MPGDYFRIKEMMKVTHDLYRYMDQKIQENKLKLNENHENRESSVESNSYIDSYLMEAEKLDKKFGKDSHLFHGRFSFCLWFIFSY